MAERVVALVVALVLVLGCEHGANPETKVETIPAAEPGPAAPVPTVEPPAVPTGNPAYELWVGPALSATDARLVDHLDRVPLGFVGIAFRVAGPGNFTLGEIEVTLAMLEQGGAWSEITRKRATLSPADDVFFKSWKLSQPGTFEVTVLDPKSGAVLAARRFEAASDAAARRNRVATVPPFELNVGPATSPTDPKPASSATIVPVGYVGLRFAPPPELSFAAPRVEVTLFRVEGEHRVIEARKVSTLGPKDNVFYKSWELRVTGIYEVEVADPDSDALFATTRFEVTPAAAPQ